MADLTRMEDGARRATERVLRCAGGQAAALRMPLPAVSGVLAEQLGMPAAGTSDVELAPVSVRFLGAYKDGGGQRWELLVGAVAVSKLAGDDTAETALGMFATAVGVVVDGQLMRIVAVSHRTVGAKAYLYRLELAGSVQDTV